MKMLRYLSLTLGLLGLLVVPSGANAFPATLHCTFTSNGGKPMYHMEIRMLGLNEFADYVDITYLLKDGMTSRESLITNPTTNDQQLWTFEISKDVPGQHMRMAIFDEVINPDDVIERWYAVAYAGDNITLRIGGACFVDRVR